MEIRYCVDKDLAQVYNLVCELEEKTLDNDGFQTAYQHNLADENSALLCAVEENEVVGFLLIAVRYMLHHADKVATIEELVVRENLRGQGIGNQLLNRSIEIAREKGCDTIELTSNLWREAAHRFYLRNGFEKRSYKFSLRLKPR